MAENNPFPTQPQMNDLQNANSAVQLAAGSKDAMLRIGRAQFEKAQSQTNYTNLDEKAAGNSKKVVETSKKGDKEALAFLGPLMPLWLPGGAEHRLVVARLVQIGDKPACQVSLLDSAAPEKLAPRRNQRPGSRRPLSARPRSGGRRARTVHDRVPVALDPGPTRPAYEDPGWTPLRWAWRWPGRRPWWPCWRSAWAAGR